MGNGGVRDSFRIQILSTTTSTSPVAMLGLMVSAVRSATMPSTAITYSARTSSALAVHGGVDVLVEDDLGDAVAVAQVDEDHAAQIAAAMHPAHQKDGLAGVGGAQLAAGVRAAQVA